MNESPKPSEIILMISGVLLFIVSFFSWVSLSLDGDAQEEVDDAREQLEEAIEAAEESGDDDFVDDLEEQLDSIEGVDGGWNAWGGSPEGSDGFPGLFPIATLAALFGLGVAVVVALKRFSSTSLSETIAGFTWSQIYLVVAGYAALVTLSFLILDKSFGQGSSDGISAGAGIGLWLALLASAGLVAGAVMHAKEVVGPGPGPGPGAAPPQSF